MGFGAWEKDTVLHLRAMANDAVLARPRPRTNVGSMAHNGSRLNQAWTDQVGSRSMTAVR